MMHRQLYVRWLVTARLATLAAACAVILGAAPKVEAAESWPARPIRLIVPFAPGGGTDMVGRVMAPRLAERLGRPVLVENRGGAGAVIGTQLVAKAPPDGYTLLVCDTAHTIQPALQKLDYDPIKSFSLIASLVRGDTVLAIPASMPVMNIAQFIALARAKPGTLVAGTAGPGSSGHMGAELFKVMADIDIVIAHYKGGGAATTDLLGGQIHLSSITIQAAVPHVKAGRLRVIGIGGPSRSPLLPDVPTVEESSPALAGYNSAGWRGLVGPAGMPAAIVDRLVREVRAVLDEPETRTMFETNGMDVDFRGPKEFAAYIAEEMKRWAVVVQRAGIKL
jgi:tripartite-type tricarboxylate transporter receptor subunit TctC